MHLRYFPYTLDFTFDAGTSRGILRQKTSWFLHLSDPESNKEGWGEAGPLPGLSPDADIDFPLVLKGLSGAISDLHMPQTEEDALNLARTLVSSAYPSVLFALETAFLNLLHGAPGVVLGNNRFLNGEQIPINGLIWMGDPSFMLHQFDAKLDQEYDCFKMKIGALDFRRECEVLKYIRRRTKAVLRVDANGAFSPGEALSKLERLNEFDLHSIEQPIAAGQWDAMALICRESPVPVALDEELIGVHHHEERRDLLRTIAPDYIILKPTLIGGITATRDWIHMAQELGIGWWMTSALESNIGLNAICQLTASLAYKGHQGLGTGQLYSNNIGSPLAISAGHIYYKQNIPWEFPVQQ